MSQQVDLSVSLGRLKFSNPVAVASGTFGTSDEYESFLDYDQLGAVITKTVTMKPRAGNPMPRICETTAGMLNSIGLQNKGVDEFLENKIPYFEKYSVPLIVNIAGESVDDFVSLAKKFDGISRVSALELNISCPNVSHGLDFCSTPEMTFDLIRRVREACGCFLIAKLSAESRDFLNVAESAVRGGADALSAINTLKGMAINIETRKPRIYRTLGGFSGPAIKPIALRYIYELKQYLDIPVIGGGGIMTAEDAVEFIIAGADMISVGTANFVDPKSSRKIVDGIAQYMVRYGLTSLDEIRGKLVKWEGA